MNIYPEYEYKCTACDGSGLFLVKDDGFAYECAKCGGIGTLLTRQGKLLIEFIERHIRLED